MNEETAPDPVPRVPPIPPPVPPVSGFHVEVNGNDRSRIIVAAGPITLTSRPQLPVADIHGADLDVVSLAWVDPGSGKEDAPTVARAVGLLLGDGPALAVVAGPTGYGKRTAGMRALWEVSRSEQDTHGKPLALQEIRPDWESPESPDVSVLPDEAGTGYLLDVAAEMACWQNPGNVADRLVAHAERLRRIGSFVVVVADDHAWPEAASGTLARAVVRTRTRPSALSVARAHLEYVHRRPDRVRWLGTASTQTGTDGAAAHLLTDGSTPADAARLAAVLAAVDDSPTSLSTAIATFQEWRSQVQDVFRKTEANPDDRALLIASVFLDGLDALSVQDAARALLGEAAETDVRTILTGPDLTTRLTGMGAEVTGRTVTLDHQPGYARAVLRHLWQQRADIHQPLLTWLDTITAPKGSGAGRLAAIGDLLVGLAVAENDIRVIEKIHAWIGSGHDSAEHRELIARVLTVAAEADPLGAAVRTRLLGWAQDGSVAVATVVALVCQGDFADHYPRQALVRLRHILDRTEPDEAVGTAQTALRDIAARDGQLPRVWSTVVKWATEKKHLAGHRAFLSLLDPGADPYVLQVMLAAAQQTPEIREALVRGWSAALADVRVVEGCRRLLTAWARAWKAGQVPCDLVRGILEEVVVRHLYSTPVSALIFGEPGVPDDEAVIDLRKELRLPGALSSVGFGREPVES